MPTDSKVLSERTRTWHICVQHKCCAKIKIQNRQRGGGLDISQQNSPWFTRDQNQALVQSTPQPSGNLELPKPVSWRTDLGIASCKCCNFQGCCLLSIHTLWEAVSKLSSKAGGKAKAECTAGPGRNTWQCWGTSPGDFRDWDWTEPLCRHTNHTLNHQRKAGFYQRHPTLPKPAWESSTHTHTPKCQFRMAQAVKKSVQSNENHLEQWEPVSSLYFANAMLSFPSNSKLSLHANAIFPCPFPRCKLGFSPAWSTPRRWNGMGIILYHTSIFHWFQHAVQ